MQPHKPMASREARMPARADHGDVVTREVEWEVDVCHGVALDDRDSSETATDDGQRIAVQTAVERELKHRAIETVREIRGQ